MKLPVSIDTLINENRLLRQELDLEREKNRQLQALLVPAEWEPPIEFCLTESERLILAILYKSPTMIKRETIMDTLYHFRSGSEIPHAKIVDVFICKLRAKMKTYGVTIDTIWGQGYILSDASRRILKNWNDNTINNHENAA
jgi:two-component system cell cycle response regulator CtrA